VTSALKRLPQKESGVNVVFGYKNVHKFSSSKQARKRKAKGIQIHARWGSEAQRRK
jgi:hypothetical protein